MSPNARSLSWGSAAVLSTLSMMFLAVGCRLLPAPLAPPVDPTPLLEGAHRVLDAIEAGSVDEAERQIRELEDLYPEQEYTRLFARFLRERLAVEAAPETTPSPTETDAPAWKTYRAVRVWKDARELLDAGRIAEACPLLEYAFTLDPENTQISTSLVSTLKQLGVEEYGEGHLDQAINHWERVLEIAPGDVESLRFLRRAEMVRERGQ